MPLVLGVDSSTAFTTVEIRDADSGRLVATGSSAHAALNARRAEQDPAMWWRSLLAAIAATERRDIAAMAVAGQQQTLVVTDSAGAVLRPAVLAIDRRSRRHARDLVDKVDTASWVDTVGLVPGPDSPLAKIAWLRSEEPELFARVGHVLGSHDWLTFRLTGRMVTDRGDASGTGFWSPRQGRWRPDVLRRLDASVAESAWLDRLPAVLGPTTPADWMTASVHEIVGLRGRPIVAAGTGRQMAAALSLGLGTNQVGVTLGSSGGVFAVADDPVADLTGRVRGYADATGRFLPTLPLPRAAAGLDGIARLVDVDHAELGRLALGARPGAGGITVTPSTATRGAVISEVDVSATPELLARAAFEGLACTVLDAVETVVGVTGHRIRGPINVAGVAARSLAFRQILADVAGVPIAAAADAHPIARGACVQAAAVLAGCAPSHINETWGPGDVEVTEPTGGFDPAAVRDAYSTLNRARRR